MDYFVLFSHAGGKMQVCRQQSSHSRRKKRRGIAAVEFAFIAPIFLLLVLGIVEFGRMYMVQQVLTNAAREGARRAIIEGATKAEVESLVDTYLASNSVSGASVSVTPVDLALLGFGDAATVSVSVPFASVTWMPSPWFLGGTTLSGESVMRAERLQ